jgi:predicted nucleic acid-binding protein
VILDTSFLIDLMNNDIPARKFAENIEQRGFPQRLPAQVLYELYVGVGHSNKTEQELEKIHSVIGNIPVIDTTDTIARTAGRMDGQLRADGVRVGANDVLIGATARHYGESVVTGNPADFERLPEVTVQTYGDGA